MFGPGPLNLLTDVAGLAVGHATDERACTGVTAILCAGPWTAGADVRGGGPGGREIDALAPENSVESVHAIVLSGGSVFGLGAADGVATILSERGVGMRLRAKGPAIPIVPAAVLHDLANEGDKAWGLAPPYRDLGMRSVDAARRDFALGAVGAGRGARAGLAKGGIGSASLDLGDGVSVGALAAINPVGSVYMPGGEVFWAWPFELGAEFGGRRPGAGYPIDPDPMPVLSRLRDPGQNAAGANTTLAVVAVSVALTKSECRRLAIMAQDGIARAVRPAHTPLDGDTVFALAGGPPLPAGVSRMHALTRLGSAAADCLARAIARGVWASRGHG